ncbi:MAG: matrixin family metalloprotease [Fuerstiella sp.]
MKFLLAPLMMAACLFVVSDRQGFAGFEPHGYYAPGTPIAGDFVLTGNSGKWGPSSTYGTTGGVVSYSYMAGGLGMDNSETSVDLGSFMPAGYKAAIAAAFAAWSAVADISFVEVADSGHDWNAAGASGDIRIGAHKFDGAGGTLAHGYWPPPNGTSAAGDIHFDSEETWKIGFGGAGFDVFQVMAHEIGHAIGLSHTGVANSLMNPFYTESFSGLQADDIAGAQFIYGAATAVPEPSGLAMFGVFAIGVLGYRRRTTRQMVA